MGFGSKSFWSGLAKAVAPVAAGYVGGPAASALTASVLGRIFAPKADDDDETRAEKERQLELYTSWVGMARALDDDATKTNDQRHHTLWSQITDDLSELYGRPPKDREVGTSFYNALSDARADFSD